MPTLSSIRIHPIKALDAATVKEARVLASAALELDRRWAIVDARGQFVNGKNRARVHALRAEYRLDQLEVALDGRVYSLERQKPELAVWLSERLGEPVTLLEDSERGFPDDSASPGPTFVSQGSIASVSEWFGWSLEETRQRFRSNVEFEGVDAFWEDRLYGFRFRVGGVCVEAINPCQRCVVPSRDPRSGQALSGFQKRFSELRRQHLPAGVDRARFDHFYRFAVNTRITGSEAGKWIRQGDPIVFPIAEPSAAR